jgi:hypothetical protein
MNRKTITLVCGVVVFLAGLILLSFVALFVNSMAGDNTLTWEMARRQIIDTGAHLLIGIALVTMGMIILLFVKSDK